MRHANRPVGKLSFRQREILEAAHTTGWVAVEQLSERFDVTPQTIRRDLTELSRKGLLDRVHGGAVPAETADEVSYEPGHDSLTAPENAVARLCVAEIPDDCSLSLGAGAAAARLAEALLGHNNLLVVTNSIGAADILAQKSNFDLVVAGGQLSRPGDGIVGDATAELIGQLKVDYAVITVAAIDEAGTLLELDAERAKVTRAFLANARRVYLIATSPRFTVAAPIRVGTVSDLDAIFTDTALQGEFQALCDFHNVAVRTTSEA